MKYLTDIKVERQGSQRKLSQKWTYALSHHARMKATVAPPAVGGFLDHHRLSQISSSARRLAKQA